MEEMTYQNTVKIRQAKFRKENPSLFNDDQIPNKGHDYILQDGRNNIYHEIRQDVIDYFDENEISWWQGKPVPHMNSSQIACVNHLFLLRQDHDAVLSIAKNASGLDLIDVVKMNCDKNPQYISFEVVSTNDLLNEGKRTRGRNCTSVDAAIIGIDRNGKRWLLPIEWKYTESYGNSCDKTGKGRPDHYREYIATSSYLKGDEESLKIYFWEPFYELMRQTIWAERICLNKESELLGCDHFKHINVIPKENTNLLDFKYRVSGKNLLDTWQNSLKDESSYVMISPEELMRPISNCKQYSSLVNYLESRYW